MNKCVDHANAVFEMSLRDCIRRSGMDRHLHYEVGRAIRQQAQRIVEVVDQDDIPALEAMKRQVSFRHEFMVAARRPQGRKSQHPVFLTKVAHRAR